MQQQIERTAAPIRQQVVRLIREDILNGSLQPGRRLIESVLCERYGVSRTVVREALRQLESEQLVQVLPRQGPIVTVLTYEEIRSIYVVRASLEGLAGRLFVLNAGPAPMAAMQSLRARLERDYLRGSVDSRDQYKAEFYEQLLIGGGNGVLMESLRSIHARVAIFRRFAFVDEDRVKLSVKELTSIMDACCVKRDADAAWKACENHIIRAGDLAVIEYDKRAKESARALAG